MGQTLNDKYFGLKNNLAIECFKLAQTQFSWLKLDVIEKFCVFET